MRRGDVLENISNFIALMETQNSNTAKVVKHVFKNIDKDIIDLNENELYRLVLDLRPNSPKHIITICYVLGLYAKWLFEQSIVKTDVLFNTIQNLDKKALWKDAKPNANKKFISYERYKKLISDIDTFEEFNSIYYKTLFMCIYEGIYNDDLSVIKNLRSSDIEDNIVTLHEDNGYSYKIKVSNELSENLKYLATLDIWERPNRYGICRVEMRGLYSDTVFKIENRTTAVDDSFRFSYYAKLRNTSREYLGNSLFPLQLYTSGIMHRLNYLLRKNGIETNEAFSNNCRNKTAHNIISAELFRCNYKTEVSNFRELVKGHLNVFENDSFGDLNDELFDDILSVIEDDEFGGFEEGEEVIFEHLTHERNAEVVALAKNLFKESHNGKIYCSNCGFDFSVRYGERGIDFIEAHHIKPVSEMTDGNLTRVEDLVLLCSNCHSIVHLKKPWLSMKELKKITLLCK